MPLTLDAQDKEDLQVRILALCNAAGKFGMREAAMLRKAAPLFPGLESAALRAEIDHLEKLLLIAPAEKSLRPDVTEWRTTAEGDRELMRRGLL